MEPSRDISQKTHFFAYGLPVNTKDIPKEEIYLKIDELYIGQQVANLIQRRALPYPINPNILFQPIAIQSCQILNTLNSHEYQLPSYPFYERKINQQPTIHPKFDKANRIRQRIHLINCNLLTRAYGRIGGEQKRVSAIEELETNPMSSTLLSGLEELNKKLELEPETSTKDQLLKIFDLYIETYQRTEALLSKSNQWNDYSKEHQVEMILFHIKETTEKEPAKEGCFPVSYAIIWLIEIGYIVKNGQVVLRKQMFNQEMAQQFADKFAEKAGLTVKRAYSKVEFFEIQKQIFSVNLYLEQENPSFEERNALKPYQDRLQKQAAQPVINENNEELTDAEKEALQKKAWHLSDLLYRTYDKTLPPQEQVLQERFVESMQRYISRKPEDPQSQS
ncbi:MAG: hypothetical protein R3E91_03225 [Chlamydiales bacterium]